MCLEKIRLPTEEEYKQIHIGYKIVKKTTAPDIFKPTISKTEETLYKVGHTTLSSRNYTTLDLNEIDRSEVHEGIHFYTDSEVEQYPFKSEDDYSLIKIEIQGKDLVAFGEGPYPCSRRYPCPYPHPCPCPCRYQAVATKIKVLEEIKEDESGSSEEQICQACT